jgi:hypothetical protein
MEPSKFTETVREVVGVFHDQESFLSAIDDLLSAGFDRAELSLLASDEAIEQKLGHAYERVQELEDDGNVPRVAFLDNDSLAEAKTGIIGGLAYVGALAAAIAAAAAAGSGGGLLGAWGVRHLGEKRAKQLQRQLEHGGLLLWVHIRDAAHETRAIDILKQHGADDVHGHDLPATADPADNPFAGLEIDPFLPGARV